VGHELARSSYTRVVTELDGELVPASLRKTIPEWAGDEGTRWLNGLPATIARLQDQWGLTVEGHLKGGFCSLVLRVRSTSMGPTVLKVPFPDRESRLEHAALVAYAGDGAVVAHAFDYTSRAMLLERVAPGESLGATLPLSQAVEVAGKLLGRLRRTPPPGVSFDSTLTTLRSWAHRFREASNLLSVRWPDLPLMQAAEFADQLCATTSPDWLVNRDAHLDNFLRSEREPWLLIDPKPMVGDPACDGGFLALDVMKRIPNCSNQIVSDLLWQLSECLGCSFTDLRSWALIRAVDNVGWAEEVGADQETWVNRALALAGL